MSEQFYYTYSTIGSGTTTGERTRARSQGLMNKLDTREWRGASRPYLSYQLPRGAYLRTAAERAPISLSLCTIDADRLLLHKRCLERDGVGRPGNFFIHALMSLPGESITRPGQETRAIPLSARTAIRMWRSTFWQTSEEGLSQKETSLPPVEQGVFFSQVGSLSAASVFESHQYCYNGKQAAADWLPQVLSAFLMLEKLGKTQICIAAPSDLVAIFIWCITHCLPRTLTVLQKFTFSTYECEIERAPSFTLVGTCWLPQGADTAAFVPRQDLPSAYYQEHPTNKVLAFNCYLNRVTPFEVGTQVQKFAQFATDAFKQNKVEKLLKLANDAEQLNCQSIDDFLTLFRLEQETPTREMVQQIFSTDSQWSLLSRNTVQEKVLALFRQGDQLWYTWWNKEGKVILYSFRQMATKSPQSLEAQALRTLACRVAGELCQALSNDQQQVAENWNDLLDMMSNTGNTNDLPIWTSFLQGLSQVSSTNAYMLWWDRIGQNMLQPLSQLATSQPAHHLFVAAFNQFVEGCINRLLLAWSKAEEAESTFWLSLIPVVLPPEQGAQRWHPLLDQLDAAIAATKKPSNWCGWENYFTVLLIWKQVATEQHPLPWHWLMVSWAQLPKLVLNQEVPKNWRVAAIINGVQHFKESLSQPGQIPLYAQQCYALLYEALTHMLSADGEREQAVAFCEFLLQQHYPDRNPLLAAILPLLFPYQEFTRRIAVAANLSEKDLVDFSEKTIHEQLTTQREIPDWLFPLLQNFLFYFDVQTVIPDFTQMSARKAWEVLEALMKRKQALPTDLHPYLECWHEVARFLRQPYFHRNVLKQVGKAMDDAPLSDATRSALKQTMIAFLAEKVETEADLARVIDVFGKYLLPVESEAWASLLLLKNLSGRAGRQFHELSRVTVYIKVLLNEMGTIEISGVPVPDPVGFIYGCLDEVLINVAQNSALVLETSQWPVKLKNKWNLYRNKRQNPQKSSAASSSSAQNNALANAVTTDAYRPRSGPLILTANGNMTASDWDGRSPVQQSSSTWQAGQPARSNKPLEERLKAFRKVYKSKDIAKIYEAYDEGFAHTLTSEERQLVEMIIQLFQGHDAWKKTGRNRELILAYNALMELPDARKFKWPDDINGTIERIREERKNKK